MVISRFARTVFTPRLAYWVVLGLSLNHIFGMNDVLEREVARLTKYTILAFIIREDVLAQRFRNLGSFLRSTFRRCAQLRPARLAVVVCIDLLRLLFWLIGSASHLVLRQVTRLLIKHILVPAIRFFVFQSIFLACMVCAMGCVVAAVIAIEVFAALLVPVYYLNLLIHRWYKPSEGATDVTQHPVPAMEESDLSTLSEVPSHSSSSHSTTLEGIRRLGLSINAHLDEASSAISVVELDDQFDTCLSETIIFGRQTPLPAHLFGRSWPLPAAALHLSFHRCPNPPPFGSRGPPLALSPVGRAHVLAVRHMYL
ncbi:hypothetical protein RhiJN_09831 [Ceratobasidium sp. AG-Ba]|nr:hypothetical protein RhiJN_09831 [Ceratobasidium sp. AG-Ba]